MRKPGRTRTYDASRRQLRAQENQERVLEVARRLFAERGYAETTLEQIASEAGIAVATLYSAFQSKRGILSRLLDRQVSGVPGGRPLLQTAGPQAVLAERDPRRALALFARGITEVQDRVGPTYEVMKSAARTEADVAELLVRAQSNRFKNLSAVAERLGALNALRKGLTIEDAARTLWTTASLEVRQMLQTFAGWSTERYTAWLEDTLVAALLR